MRAFKAQNVPRLQIELNIPGLLEAGPIDLEIGAGQGLHAVRYAQANPSRTLIAVERTSFKFSRMKSRATRHSGLSNLIPVHADAVSLVTHCIPPASLDRVFLLYPNPYPKAKQANLRWCNSPFMAELMRKIRPGGEIYLATNLEWYAAESRDKLVAQWGLHLAGERRVSPAEPPRTHFEKKYLERGESCFDLQFQLPR
jgi:tRNA (guanine-N7-)-methyltransferase